MASTNGNGSSSVVDQVVDDVCGKAKAAMAVVIDNMVKALDDLIAHAEEVKKVLRAKQQAHEASIENCIAVTQDATKVVADGRARIEAITQAVA